MRNLFVIICTVLLFVSCKETKNSRALGDENAGKTLIGWYYYNLGEKKYDDLKQYLDEDFFKTTTEAEFFGKLKEREATLGHIIKAVFKEGDLMEENKKEKIKEFEFDYDVQYEKSAAVETFHLIKRGDEFKIAKIDF
ncbi:hypothetical protein HX004_07620 [Myroides sp. 1354]|uniref:hypothetical protein n=1 Tax=unclassified Myroides TaxID=2642485 RepID=UPI0025781E12|nr:MULTISPECIES: hypothetical protein [unclassified Myroides]MDM1044929.1 hypothetical protein [Myroides sp. R163-1]MDM1055642.1 hypothetical protein [Myroides sp. 1354]MDM1068939.1 hypothetical protein [Myroides sp. 1372]